MSRILRPAAALVAVAAAMLALSGCSAGRAEYSDSAGASDAAPQVAQQDAAVAGEEAAASPEQQALVVTGTITITADDPIAAAEEATALTVAAGGRVDARREYAPRDGDAGSATLTLRIPAAELEGVRDGLARLGTVEETDVDSVDVGGRQRDLDTRITTLRASIARYTAWLADADTTSDLIELESAISERQTELETLEAQQRELADQVAMSTITLQLYSPASTPAPEGPTTFWEGLVAGWAAFAGFWVAVAVALGVGLPWLVLLALVLTVVVVIARRAGRRPASAPLVAAAAPATATAPAAPESNM